MDTIQTDGKIIEKNDKKLYQQKCLARCFAGFWYFP